MRTAEQVDSARKRLLLRAATGQLCPVLWAMVGGFIVSLHRFSDLKFGNASKAGLFVGFSEERKK